MLEVSEAADRIYLLSNVEPRRRAIIRRPDGEMVVCGLRAFNPLDENWRVVYEELGDAEESAALMGAEVQRIARSDVEFDLIVDGYTFWFSGLAISGLPKSITDIRKPVRHAA